MALGQTTSNDLVPFSSLNTTAADGKDTVDVLTGKLVFDRQKIADLFQSAQQLSEHKRGREALRAYEEVATYCDQCLTQNRTLHEAFCLKAEALCRSADLLAARGELKASYQSYLKAAEASEAALLISPTDVRTLNVLAVCETGCGKVLTRIGKTTDAEKCFLSSIKDCENGIRLEPTNKNLYLCKGNAWLGEADLNERLREASSKIVENLNAAIECYNKALEINPKYINGLNNKAIALRKLGKIGQQLGNSQTAKDNLEEAIKIDSEILKLAPGHSYANKNIKIAKKLMSR